MTNAGGLPRLRRAGDSAIIVAFEARIDRQINARCVAVATAIRDRLIPGVLDVVPAYATVTVYFDPRRAEHASLVEEVRRAATRPVSTGRPAGQAHRIPVCYGDEFGPDLAAVASFGRMSPAAAIALHTAPEYWAFMLGFVPGFAYLGTVDPRIAVPRLEAPRTRVVAGSVAIAAGQTAVYPIDGPGGWQVIGRTPLRVFDPSRRRPALLEAGDTVHFFSIGRSEWDRYAS